MKLCWPREMHEVMLAQRDAWSDVGPERCLELSWPREMHGVMLAQRDAWSYVEVVGHSLKTC